MIILDTNVLSELLRPEPARQVVEGLLDEDFRDRILPFDRAAACAYATIAAARRAAGRPISQFDCQIAAIARARKAAVATRNTSDYEDGGIDLIDPWSPNARQ